MMTTETNNELKCTNCGNLVSEDCGSLRMCDLCFYALLNDGSDNEFKKDCFIIQIEDGRFLGIDCDLVKPFSDFTKALAMAYSSEELAKSQLHFYGHYGKLKIRKIEMGLK